MNPKVDRNAPCSCGSGKKFKHCCQRKQATLSSTNGTQHGMVSVWLQMALENMRMGRMQQGIAFLKQILNVKPDHPEALYQLGFCAFLQGDSATAIELMGQAIAAKPTEPSYQVNLGNVYMAIGQPDKAALHFQQGLQINPRIAEVHNNMGTALSELGKLEEAIPCFEHAIAIKPKYAEAHNNLGMALLDTGAFSGAVQNYRLALEVNPGLHDAHSNLLMAMQYMSEFSAQDVWEEHQRFAQTVQRRVLGARAPHANNRQPNRRLKIGYVSGDFRNHAVAFFILPILAAHNKAEFEVYCYYNHSARDSHTAQIAAHADHWLDCKGMEDSQLAARIRQDGIDILIDLSGHTANNRLPMFALKPAPVQVTWIGFAGTTGLPAMDYRITDVHMDPLGLTERYHSEALVRLPGSNIAYRPEPGCPEVNALPALSTGSLVFASLNNLTKISNAVVQLWAKILLAVPNAKLMLGNTSKGGIAEKLVSMFVAAGVEESRLMLMPRMPMLDYLELHHRIDVALDPFPYNGGTTSMHSLWMGVPVLTLAGQHSVSRQGVAVVSRVGLEQFIASNEDEYFQRAVQVAEDLNALSHLRQTLRHRMEAANGGTSDVAGELERALRTMWRNWCESARD